MEKRNYANIAFLVIVWVYVLKIWASLIIPFFIAVLFSFAVIWLSQTYQKIKIPKWFSLWLSIITYFFIFWLFGQMLGSNIEDVIKLLPKYQDKILNIYSLITGYLPFELNFDLKTIFEKINIQQIFTSVVWWISNIFWNAGLILFYVMFILLEYRFIFRKIDLMIIDKKKNQKFKQTISKIKSDIKSYFVIKALVSFISSFVAFIVMSICGLDFALFWAMLIFFLNFIPNIGSIISYSFPLVLSLIQFPSILQFVVLVCTFIWIEIFVWNIIEPKLVWNKLNLSPLAIILVLWFWWSLWGVVGMILAVPITVIINIVLSKFEQTRPFAILLSEKWDIEIDEDLDKWIIEKLKQFKRK